MGLQAKALAASVLSELLSDPEIGPLRKLSRDYILFQQHQDGRSAFLIASGLVKLIRSNKNGDRLIVSILSSDDLVGDEALGQHEYLTDVTCLTDVTGYHIPGETLKRIQVIPELATALWNYAVVRHLDRIKRIEMVTHHDVEYRILHALADLACLVKPVDNGAHYPIPITQLEMAIFVGATRETASTTLSNLQEKHLVTLSRRLITTVAPELLIAAANNRRRNSHPDQNSQDQKRYREETAG